MWMPGESVLAVMQSKRVIAHSGLAPFRGFPESKACGKVERVVERSSNRSPAVSLHRYPSPDRPAYSPSRPITVFRPCPRKKATDIGYQCVFAIHFPADRVNCGATLTTTIGLSLCKRHQSSLLQWQCSAWPVASKATWNAAWPVQAQALSQPRFWALTQLGQCLPVLLLAYCATTQASTAAVKLDNRAHHGRVTFRNRRRGHAPAAVFCFGDEK